MSQLSKGTIYADGGEVTYSNLNALVDNATVLPGVISEQPAASSVSTTDTMLVNQSGVLRKATVEQVKSSLSLSDYLKADGSVSMATGQQLTLGSTAQIASLNAVSLGYLQANYFKNNSYTSPGGYERFTGIAFFTGAVVVNTGSTLVLGQDPTDSLQAATKQYVDAGSSSTAKARASFSGLWSNGTLVSALYSKPINGSNPITITTVSAHGFKQDQRVYLDFTSGTAQPTDAIYTVASVIDDTRFTVAGTTNASSGNCQFKKALIHSSVNVDSIIFCGTTATGLYICNLTNSFTNQLFIPSITTSTQDSVGTQVATWAGVTDMHSGSSVARTVNSFAFSGTDFTSYNLQFGYRAGLLVF